jgi:glutaconate CoA-transferase subunit B
VVVVVRQSPRTFVERVGFRTSTGERVSTVITDLGVLTRGPGHDELVLTQIHPGATVDAVRAATGWDLRVADDVAYTASPSDTELDVLRELEATKGAVA